MLKELDQQTASRIIQSLAQSGQPPKFGASYLNVGTEPEIQRLKADYLQDILLPYEGQDGGGACKWIEANYGNGKTQFLRCMQEEAWQLGYVTAFVELSQDECPLDRPDLIYGAVARSIQAPPHALADIDRGRGIDVALQQLLDRKFQGVLSGTPDDDLRNQAVAWVETSLGSTPVESTGFRTAVVQYLLAKLQGEADRSRVARMYLRGEAHAAKDAKAIGVFEKIDKSSGFRLLRSCCQLLQRSELAAGTVLLFDEARRSLSLMSSKVKKLACEHLLTVINRCNSGELPGTLFLYAVMPEFFAEFVVLYPAMQQRCGPGTRINLDVLQGVDEIELLERIGKKIGELFSIAYPGAAADGQTLTANLRHFARAAEKQALVGNGSRRILVGGWVRALQQFRTNGARSLSQAEVHSFMEGAREQLDAYDAEVVGREGE